MISSGGGGIPFARGDRAPPEAMRGTLPSSASPSTNNPSSTLLLVVGPSEAPAASCRSAEAIGRSSPSPETQF